MTDAINLARIDFVSLRLVACCVQTGSLSSACQVVHLSLSGASHRLCCLENTLRVKLFIRRRRGLEPTTAGLLVAQHADRMMALLDEMQDHLSMPTRSASRFHLGEPARFSQ